MEVILEVWVDHEGDEDAASPGAAGVQPEEHGVRDGYGGTSVASQQQPQQQQALLRTSKPAPWFPDLPGLPLSPASPLQWVDAAPVAWLCDAAAAAAEQRPLLDACPREQQPLDAASTADCRQSQVGTMADGRSGQDLQPLQQTVDLLPPMASIGWVSSVCIYIPRRTSLSVELSLSGTNLCLPECEVLGRSASTPCYAVQKHRVLKKAASVQVTVHGVTSPTALLLEARMHHLLSRSRVVLLVDCETMARELQALEDARGRSAEANDELLRDLGSWLEYSEQRISSSSSSAATHPAAAIGSSSSSASAAVPALAAVAEQGELQRADVAGADQGSCIADAWPGGHGSITRHAPGYHNKVMSIGFHILEHAVEVGWCAVSQRIVKEMMEVHGLSISAIFQRATSDGMSLLHRAIRSYNIQMLHTVLRWGDMFEWEWGLDRLVPATTCKGQQVQVSALHMAAAMSDNGYAGELLLLKYAKARLFWRQVRDSQGLLPCHYATFAGNGHLDLMAGSPPSSSSSEPLPCSAEQQQQQQLDLPRLPDFSRLPPLRVRGRRVPRAKAGPPFGAALAPGGLAAGAGPAPPPAPVELSAEALKALGVGEGYAERVGRGFGTGRSAAAAGSLPSSAAAIGGRGAPGPLGGAAVVPPTPAFPTLPTAPAAPDVSGREWHGGGFSGVAGVAAGAAARVMKATVAAAPQPDSSETRLLDFISRRWPPFVLLYLLTQLLLAGLLHLLAPALPAPPSPLPAAAPALALGLQLLPTAAMLLLAWPHSRTNLRRCLWACEAACFATRSLGAAGWSQLSLLTTVSWPLLGLVHCHWLMTPEVEQVMLPLVFLCLVLDLTPDGVDASRLLGSASGAPWTLGSLVVSLGLKLAAAAAAHAFFERWPPQPSRADPSASAAAPGADAAAPPGLAAAAGGGSGLGAAARARPSPAE